MTDTSAPRTVQIDIISDIMCPWCIVGFKQVQQALAMTGLGARIRWHPFELNPDMAPEGENLTAHIMRKYGSSVEQSQAARQNLQDIGTDLGITFNFNDDSRIVNSFDAHKLLDYAASCGLQHPLKLALFEAHFAHGIDVSDRDALIGIASSVGLEETAARAALDAPQHAKAVRAQQAVWQQNGISGVPTMIFGEKYVVSGAQGANKYTQLLLQANADPAPAS